MSILLEHGYLLLFLVYLQPDEEATVCRVCKQAQHWVKIGQDHEKLASRLRGLRPDEIEELIGRIKRSFVGPRWATGRTVRYLQNILPDIKEFPTDVTTGQMSAFMDQVVQIYTRCMVAPNTCVGALDTTRTIERLTQARLSRFHTTGSVHVSFLKSGSLDSLLHPLSTATAPRMLVALRSSHVDASSAAGVIESIRGVLVSIELSHVVDGAPMHLFSEDCTPGPLNRLCGVLFPNLPSSPCCLMFWLQTDAMFHHRILPHTIAHKINTSFEGILAMVLFNVGRQKWALYVAVSALARLGQQSYENVLPQLVTQLPLKDACQDITVNVIFDTGSTGIPQKLRYHTPGRSDIEGMLQFLQFRNEQIDSRGAVRRRSAPSASCSSSFAVRAGTSTRTRRRCFSGARKPRGDSTHRTASLDDDSGVLGQKATMAFIRETLGWFAKVFAQVLLSYEARPSLMEDHSGFPVEVFNRVKFWQAEVIDLLKNNGAETIAAAWLQRVRDPLHSIHAGTHSFMFVLEHTLMRCLTVLVHSNPTTACRADLLTGVFNEVVYHTCGRLLAQPYMQYRICSRLLPLSLCGLAGIRGAVASHNMSTKEWVVLTEGSAFREFIHQARHFPQLDISNSTTTSIPEILELLGIEACHQLFTNGSLASSLGVNNHCCMLLSSHISRNGTFRGVNRSGILGSPLDSITVEDPAKHIRDAAIVGAKDNCLGSSANILLGKSVNAGTAAFDVLYNVGCR